ncbi:MAG: peptide deformylase [Verrucomicrobia bacterium]|nr:MAG: peptide deformylase [Verrucomicrobiota bacterium]
MSRILQVALIGNPILRERAPEVPNPEDPRIQILINDLLATMGGVNGVGLAAPQVNESVRLFVMQSRKGELFPNAPDVPPMEVINPEVLSESEELDRAWESCYSMPGYKALITRPAKILARWQNRYGELIESELRDLAARVFLHELDHLDGKMFLDRMDSISDLHAKMELVLAREDELR